jgi:predicted amidophosphoribosyltransferase
MEGFKHCPRCGDSFRDSEGFETCWDCRRPLTRQPSGCHHIAGALDYYETTYAIEKHPELGFDLSPRGQRRGSWKTH